jgi:hypothetical protein
MKHLSLLTLSLSVALTMLFSIFMMVARTQAAEPDVAQVLGLDVCDGTPCLWGMTPGVTRWVDVSANLSKRPGGKKSGPCVTFNYKATNDHTVVACTAPDQVTLGMVEFGVARIHPISTLGATIRRYGPPCLIIANQFSRFRSLTLLYPKLIIQVSVPERRLEPAASIVNIMMLPQKLPAGWRQNLCDKSTVDTNNVAKTWRGFTWTAYYHDGGR